MGNEVAVRILLETGADAEALSEPYSSAWFADPQLKSAHRPRGTALRFAAGVGDPLIVRLLIENGANPRRPDPDSQRTALHFAAREGTCECIKVLLLAGGDIEAADSSLLTPLHVAVRYDQGLAVDLLLDRGAKAKHANRDGMIPLAVAASLGYESIVKQLLKGRSRIPPNDDLTVPLMAATAKNHHAIARLLLDHNADMHATTNHPFEMKQSYMARHLHTAYFYAELVGDRTMLELFRSRLETPVVSLPILFCAIRHNDLMLAMTAVENDVDPSGGDCELGENEDAASRGLGPFAGHLDQRGLRVVLEAVSANAHDVFQYLSPRISPDAIQTALTVLVANNEPDDWIRRLLQAGADPKASTIASSSGSTTTISLITMAALGSRPSIVRILAEAGADVRTGGVGLSGIVANPLCCAVERDDGQDGDMVRELLSLGADPSLSAIGGNEGEGDSWPPLWKAVVNDKPAMVRLLLEAGAAPNGVRVTDDGEVYSCLHSTFMLDNLKNRLEMARLLLEARADPDARLRGPLSYTPLKCVASWVVEKDRAIGMDLCRLLYRHGASRAWQDWDGSVWPRAAVLPIKVAEDSWALTTRQDGSGRGRDAPVDDAFCELYLRSLTAEGYRIRGGRVSYSYQLMEEDGLRLYPGLREQLEGQGWRQRTRPTERPPPEPGCGIM